MAVRPVRFISDVLTKKQILKTDADNNILFNVSSSTDNKGHVSSSLAYTGSGLFINGDAYISGTLHAKRMHVTEVTTSVYYEDSISASINALYDVSASNAVSGNMFVWNGSNWIATNDISGNFSGVVYGDLVGTASYAYNAGYASQASSSNYASTASYAVNAATALTALYAVNAGNLIGSGTTNTIPIFTNDTTVGDSSLKMSGSTLIAGNDIVVSGNIYFNNAQNLQNIDFALNSPTNFYGISDVFNAINNKFGLLIQNYNNLSETITGTFDVDGTKVVELSNFIAADLDNVYLDVMIKPSGSNHYVNDLISVELYANIPVNKLYVELTAIALTNTSTFRIIATKQTGSLF